MLCLQEVKRLARRLRVPLYFVVHNLDAPALRGNCRRALASLASCGNVRLLPGEVVSSGRNFFLNLLS